MINDLFTEYLFEPPVRAHAAARTTPMSGLTTAYNGDGTRTLAHGATVLGHYERTKARGWRGVTHGGLIVRAPTEAGVRRALAEGAI